VTASGPGWSADTVYKVVQPDGTVTYSDRPSTDGSSQKFEFHNLPATPLPESALKFRAEIEKSIKSRALAQRDPQPGELRFFTAKWCPHCRRAKAYLEQRRLPYTEYDIDTADGMAAFVQASGHAVPLLVSSSGRVQGYSEAKYEQFLSAVRRP
jgi:glutaredoxin